MKCQYCGLDNVAGASFCKNCGNRLQAQPTPPSPSYQQNVATPVAPSNAPQPYAQSPAPSSVPSYPQPAPPYPQGQQANWGAPNAWNVPPAQPVPSGTSIRRIQKISAVSVLKVVAAIYGLMYAVFGLLFIVLPGVFGAGLLDILGLNIGGGIFVTLLIYILSVAVAALSAGVIAAIGALIYNLVVRYIGGIEVEVV